jgi:hypothetical protein
VKREEGANLPPKHTGGGQANSISPPLLLYTHPHKTHSGLDNAGKTAIVKRLNGEDITTISPTLGFNIKTLTFRGCAQQQRAQRVDAQLS